LLGPSQDEQFSYYVMEYLPGLELYEAVKHGEVPVEQCGGIIKQIGAALDYLHGRGYVHGNVSPQNILLDRNRQTAKLAGFTHMLQEDDPTLADPAFVGYASFAPPEQYLRRGLDTQRNAAAADVRQDVFALGMTALYILSSGKEIKRERYSELP